MGDRKEESEAPIRTFPLPSGNSADPFTIRLAETCMHSCFPE